MANEKQLKGFAFNLAHQFSVSAEYFARLAYAYNVRRVEIDLLNIIIYSEEFDCERNRTLVRYCLDNIKRNILGKIPISSTILIAEFGIDKLIPGNNFDYCPKAIFTVTITDSRGRKWSGCKTVMNQAVDKK